jgi:hypothetical protein
MLWSSRALAALVSALVVALAYVVWVQQQELARRLPTQEQQPREAATQRSAKAERREATPGWEAGAAAAAAGAGDHGSGSGQGDAARRETKRTAKPAGFNVEFRNRADRSLDLYWKSVDGKVVLQATVEPSFSTTIGTFAGHHFFWAEEGEEKPLAGSNMVMHDSKLEVSFSGSKPVSKWAPLVKDKLRIEREQRAAAAAARRT